MNNKDSSRKNYVKRELYNVWTVPIQKTNYNASTTETSQFKKLLVEKFFVGVTYQKRATAAVEVNFSLCVLL